MMMKPHTPLPFMTALEAAALQRNFSPATLALLRGLALQRLGQANDNQVPELQERLRAMIVVDDRRPVQIGRGTDMPDGQRALRRNP